MKHIRVYILAVLCCTSVQLRAQMDTSKVLDEFGKVMSFASQPYVYYQTSTKVTATPVIKEDDTLSLTGVFYKCNEMIYANNGLEETYIQDSLQITVNGARKSIWIKRIDPQTKARLNALPATMNDFKKIFQGSYYISKETADGIIHLQFNSKKELNTTSSITTLIKMNYRQSDLQPVSFVIDASMQELVSEELLDALKEENINTSLLIKQIDNVSFFVRKQSIELTFLEISMKKEKALLMPLWKENIEYSEVDKKFVVKGKYSSYVITSLL